MTESIFTIKENVALTDSVYKMTLEGDTSALSKPGQFVNIKLEGKFLRRPISVCEYGENSLVLIYKVVGSGTEDMSVMQAGKELNLLVGLGNGFNPDKSGDAPLLIGGGVGIPPLYGLCKELIAKGAKPTVILGFNTKSEIFLEKEFENLGAKVIVATADGSYGVKGFVTDAIADLTYSFFYTCGPLPMFKAIEAKATGSGQYSFEERMGCGFGACMGCSCKTKYGDKRICKDGPVLDREEVIW